MSIAQPPPDIQVVGKLKDEAYHASNMPAVKIEEVYNMFSIFKPRYYFVLPVLLDAFLYLSRQRLLALGDTYRSRPSPARTS